jgi:hypothetical protein
MNTLISVLKHTAGPAALAAQISYLYPIRVPPTVMPETSTVGMPTPTGTD